MIRPAEKVEDGYCLANKKLGFDLMICMSAQWIFALNVAVSCPHPFRNLGSRRWTPREFKNCLATKRSTRPHLSTTRTLCLHTSTLASENRREGEDLEFGRFFLCVDDAVNYLCVLSGERLGWGRHSCGQANDLMHWWYQLFCFGDCHISSSIPLSHPQGKSNCWTVGPHRILIIECTFPLTFELTGLFLLN